MFDFVYELTLDFISTLGWYIPILVLFSFIYGFFDFKRSK